MWIPGFEQRYNEGVKINVQLALGSEYENFSVPEAKTKPGVYPRVTTDADVASDSLYLIPRISNYADPLKSYYEAVTQTAQDDKP